MRKKERNWLKICSWIIIIGITYLIWSNVFKLLIPNKPIAMVLEEISRCDELKKDSNILDCYEDNGELIIYTKKDSISDAIERWNEIKRLEEVE